MRLNVVGLFALAIAAGPQVAAQTVTVTGFAEVQDGDTVGIGPVVIRLNGIDAPEAGQPCQGKGGRQWDCGKSAADALRGFIGREAVVCAVLDRDAYGRLIGDCQAGGIDLSGALIDAGQAWAYREHSDKYAEQEDASRLKRLGIWSGENRPPWEYRADRWARAAAASPRAGCPIKGNISGSGERIYHTPWSSVYGRTKIDEAKGERWFCDEAEAVAEGWRASRAR